MIRYKYNSQVTPPAPFVHVTIRTSDRAKELPDQPAQLDCAADRTVLPLTTVEKLGIAEVRQRGVEGIGGSVTFLPTFLVQIEVRQLPPLTLEVLASKGEPYILLGRDVLNHFRVMLDGPNLALEIE